MAFFEKITGFIHDWLQKLTAEEKRRIALVCTAVFVILLTLSVIMPMSSGRGKKFVEPERMTIFYPIPAEELFLPDEPDFLPEVILERERRSSWTEQDVSEYWQDPLKFGEEQWREKIEAAIDVFLERVP